MKSRTSGLLLVLLLPNILSAQDRHVAFGGFVDSYYAWDFGRPPTRDRSFAGGTPFTTQPARHNEFNVNLAFVEGVLRIADSLWVDAGIFFSNVGMEGWISSDNVTYTRSLVAEYSPYYQSGAKVSWMRGPWRLRFDLVNGWQNVSENNDGKAVGVRLDWIRGSTTLSYYNLISAEPNDRLRVFQGVGGRLERGMLTVLAEADLGSQTRSSADGSTAWWYGFTSATRVRVGSRVAIVGRIEAFEDRDQIVLGTGALSTTPNPPCRCKGVSFGVDVGAPASGIWRTELRGFRADTAVFPNAGGTATTNALLVTSLALTVR